MAIRDATALPVVVVDDIDRAIIFYRDKLGLEVHRMDDAPDSAYVELGGGSGLVLYKSTFRRGDTTAATFVVDDVESAVRELRSRGVTFEDYDQPGLKTVNGVATMGQMKSAWFKDSGGNVIAVALDLRQLLRKAA